MWIQLVGAAVGAAGSYLSSKNANKGSGGTPDWVQKNQQKLFNQSQGMDYQVAGLTPDQQNAMQGVRDMQGKYNPYWDETMANAQDLAQGIGADDIRGFYNPYEDDVIGAYLNDLGVMRNRADMQAGADAEAAGAFGGDREAVYRAVTQGEYDRTGANTLANLRYQGWDSASNIALRNQAQRTVGNQQLGDLINDRTRYDYADLDALMGIGNQQQMLDQAALDAPLRTLSWRSDLNNAGSYSSPMRTGPYVDPMAAMAAGAQGGYRAGQGVYDYGVGKGWWGKPTGAADDPTRVY